MTEQNIDVDAAVDTAFQSLMQTRPVVSFGTSSEDGRSYMGLAGLYFARLYELYGERGAGIGLLALNRAVREEAYVRHDGFTPGAPMSTLIFIPKPHAA